MITYSIWKQLIDEFDIYTTDFEKIATYTALILLSLFTICLDIISLPFLLLGLVVFLITKKRGK